MTDRAADAELHDYTPMVPTPDLALTWPWFAIPFADGVFELALKAEQLFQSPCARGGIRCRRGPVLAGQ